MPPTGGHPCPVPLDNQETLASSGKITEALPRPGTGAGHRPISHKIQPMHPLLTQVSYPLAPPRHRRHAFAWVIDGQWAVWNSD